jgi:hypothetical protein
MLSTCWLLFLHKESRGFYTWNRQVCSTLFMVSSHINVVEMRELVKVIIQHTCKHTSTTPSFLTSPPRTNCRCYSHSIQGQNKHREKSGYKGNEMPFTCRNRPPAAQKQTPICKPPWKQLQQPLIAVSRDLFVLIIRPGSWSRCMGQSCSHAQNVIGVVRPMPLHATRRTVSRVWPYSTAARVAQ